MDKGYIENGFIVDVSNAHKTSEIIYELSRILDIPDAQSKKVCLKLGSVDLSPVELTSIKALVESMNSEIEFVSTSSKITEKSAEEINIEVSVLENKVPLPEFNSNQDNIKKELERALDKIFGDENSEIKTFADDQIDKLKEDVPSEYSYAEFQQNEEARNEEFIEEASEKEVKEISAEFEQIINEKQEDIIQPISDEKFDENSHGEYDESVRETTSMTVDETTAKEQDFEDSINDDEDSHELKEHLRETEKLPTLYIKRTLRSGQSISSDGNIVIIGDVNPGSEIIARGDITVWGILGGIAHAGSEGNCYARIRALKMNAIQLRIADVFARRPDSINIPYVQKEETYTPEVASIRKKQIIIQKIH